MNDIGTCYKCNTTEAALEAVGETLDSCDEFGCENEVCPDHRVAHADGDVFCDDCAGEWL